MKKKSKGLLCMILGMMCSLLFVLPLYVKIFVSHIDDQWIMLSIAPGLLGCGLLVCGNYIQSLEYQLATMSQTK